MHGPLGWEIMCAAVFAGLPLAVVVDGWVFTPREHLHVHSNWFYLQQTVILLPALLFLLIAPVLGCSITRGQIAAGMLALVILWLAKWTVLSLLMVIAFIVTGTSPIP